VHFRRPPPYLEHTGQHAGLTKAARHAGLHDMPEGEQLLADLCRAAPGLFIRQHQLEDFQSVLAA
jgi:hypothetical protein